MITYYGIKLYQITTRLGIDLKYIVCADIPISQGEWKIAEALNELKIIYQREISFLNFKSPKGGLYRYDFILPKYKIILEYDGLKYHKNKISDTIKNEFCKRNGIKIFRFSGGDDFYNMKEKIKNILTPTKYLKIFYN